MADEPWIMYSAKWVSRMRSSLVLHDEVTRFVTAVAVDPAPHAAALSINEDLGETFARATRNLPSTDENIARELAAIGYRPSPLVDDALEQLDTGVHRPWATGSGGFQMCWEWKRGTRRSEIAPLIAFYRDHLAWVDVPNAPAKRGIGLSLVYDFEVKRPGTDVPLFLGAPYRSSILHWVEQKRASIALRYASPELTPALRDVHDEIVAAFGPKRPRASLWRVTPANPPGGREHKTRIE